MHVEVKDIPYDRKVKRRQEPAQYQTKPHQAIHVYSTFFIKVSVESHIARANLILWSFRIHYFRKTTLGPSGHLVNLLQIQRRLAWPLHKDDTHYKEI